MVGLRTFKDLILLFCLILMKPSKKPSKKVYIYLQLFLLKESTSLKVSVSNESIYARWKKMESNLMFNSNNHWQKNQENIIKDD